MFMYMKYIRCCGRGMGWNMDGRVQTRNVHTARKFMDAVCAMGFDAWFQQVLSSRKLALWHNRIVNYTQNPEWCLERKNERVSEWSPNLINITWWMGEIRI